jgi:hypothetical protein
MQRGCLIIYDKTGKIWYNSGEAEGSVLPHVTPDGLPYIELPFGELNNKILVGVDTAVTPHVLITEDIPHRPSQEDLENAWLIWQGVI